MKAGCTIKARTNAELLNMLLKTNYKQWYKCTYPIKEKKYPTKEKIMIWMVRLDNTKNGGFQNRPENDTIIEQFDKSEPKPASFYSGIKTKCRLVFEKIETKVGHIYKFHGLYMLDKREDDDYKRTLVKISDEYEF